MSSNQLGTYLALFAASLCIAMTALGLANDLADVHARLPSQRPRRVAVGDRIGKSVSLIDYIMYVSVEY
ncbi:MAG TPA: hypothetical protein VM163_10960 [bacterium]|nr:hypothetical protein [bacterium]